MLGILLIGNDARDFVAEERKNFLCERVTHAQGHPRMHTNSAFSSQLLLKLARVWEPGKMQEDVIF